MSTHAIDKGKQRAREVSEETPLLPRASTSQHELDTRPPHTSRQSRCFVATLIALILSIVFIGVTIYSFAHQVATKANPDRWKDALSVNGPFSVQLLNASHRSVWMQVGARIGVEAPKALDLDYKEGDNLFRRFKKALGRWGVERVHKVSVNASTVSLHSLARPLSSPLLTLDFPSFEIPITARAESEMDKSWLEAVSFPVHAQFPEDASVLAEYMQLSWKAGALNMCAKAPSLEIIGGAIHGNTWRKFVHLQFTDFRTNLSFPIPPINGLPKPGEGNPFPNLSKLVSLNSFSISTNHRALNIKAIASAVNPLPSNINLKDMAFGDMDFTVSISDPASSKLPIASAGLEPVHFTHPNISLSIFGSMLPLRNASSAISAFLSRYLSALPNVIYVSTPALVGLDFPAIFPAADPPPHILQNATIHDMKVMPGTPAHASGTIVARLVLPKGFQIGLNVSRLLPDVLILDGAVPFSPLPSNNSSLPDPIPQRAFARIQADEWIPAHTEDDETQSNAGASFRVTAQFVDVPIEILPGRQKEFSNFVSKVIFGSDGAVAGILGTVDVKTEVKGIHLDNGRDEQELKLVGLPFKGSVKVRKGSLHHITKEME